VISDTTGPKNGEFFRSIACVCQVSRKKLLSNKAIGLNEEKGKK